MKPKRLSQFRTVAILEGVSFLVLLGIAMPLKYWADLPVVVRVDGMAHGLLFSAYIVTLGRAASAFLWPPLTTLALFAAAVLPFGCFVADRWLRRQTT